MAKQTKQDYLGTSFHNVEIKATPRRLMELFPDSFTDNNDGENKVNFNFVLETNNGKVFTIYDYKEYRRLDLDEIVDWHIGAKTFMDSMRAKEELEALLRPMVYIVRDLISNTYDIFSEKVAAIAFAENAIAEHKGSGKVNETTKETFGNDIHWCDAECDLDTYVCVEQKVVN
jgi:hypothetical protein